MVQFKTATARSIEEAEAVLFGVPTDLGAESPRKGRADAPDKIRQVSNFLYDQEQGDITLSLFDNGNLKQGSKNIADNLTEISEEVHRLLLKNKTLVILGGDCSIKYGVVKGLNKLNKKIGIIYFDSHPDLVERDIPYYGSTMADNIKLENVDPKACIILGARNIENREVELAKKKGIKCLTMLDIKELGLKKTFDEIKKVIKNADIVHLSIDIDVVDPAFAPGVGCPCPGGLSAIDLLYLIKMINKLKISSIDFTEYIPKYDPSEITGQLICRCAQEFLSK